VPVVRTATIVNQDPNREVALWVPQTKLYNASSQAYPASEATLAGVRGSGNDWLRVKLLQGRSTEAVFRFEGVPSSDRELAQIDIRAVVGVESFTLECTGNVVLQ
jgi:hypothetical protein